MITLPYSLLRTRKFGIGVGCTDRQGICELEAHGLRAQKLHGKLPSKLLKALGIHLCELQSKLLKKGVIYEII